MNATLIQIANRAEKLTGIAKINFLLDLSTVNVNVDWENLLNSADHNFLHDVCGINKHLDRETGELKNCLLPKFIKAL